MKISDNHKSSLIFFVGNFSLSVFRYLFHLILLRLLLPEQYGEFLTLLSLIYILSVPTATIATVTTKTVSSLLGKSDLKSINGFFHFLLQKVFYPLSILGLFVIIFSQQLSEVFKTSQSALIVLGVSTSISSVQTIVGSYLLGLHQLVRYSIFGLLSVIITIAVSIILVNFGLASLGAVIGQVSGGLLATVIAYLWIKNYISPPVKSIKRYNIGLKSLTSYSFLNSLSSISMISSDILLVRVLLDSYQSGIYASLSIIGRVIVFGLSPLSSLILTYSAKRQASGLSNSKLFKKVSFVAFVLGLTSGAIFSIFPHTILKIFSGNNFLEATQYLGVFAFSMVFYSWSQFILSYYNGTGRERYNLVFFAFAILQPITIALYGKSVKDLSIISFYLQLSLFLTLLSLLLKPWLTSVKIKHVFGKKK